MGRVACGTRDHRKGKTVKTKQQNPAVSSKDRALAHHIAQHLAKGSEGYARRMERSILETLATFGGTITSTDLTPKPFVCDTAN